MRVEGQESHLIRGPVWLRLQVPDIQLRLVGVCHNYVRMLRHLSDLIHLQASPHSDTLQCRKQRGCIRLGWGWLGR